MKQPGGCALLLVALFGAGCEDIPYLPAQPQVLAVDIIDNQAPPARVRLLEGGMAVTGPLPDLGPDLSLRVYLSAPLSAGALMRAPTSGVLVNGDDGQQASARGFQQPAPNEDANAPAGTAQILSVTPDLRSGRTYTLRLDSGELVSAGSVRFEVTPLLRFHTARRFVVRRASPPSQPPLGVIAEVVLTLTSPAEPRVSGGYGVRLTNNNQVVPVSMALSSDRRQLIVSPLCDALPQGTTEIFVDVGGLEEDSTLLPLAEAFRHTVTVSTDPGPCRDLADLGLMDMQRRDM